jgi:hypothetical protein
MARRKEIEIPSRIAFKITAARNYFLLTKYMTVIMNNHI